MITNFRNEHGNAIKPAIVAENRHVGNFDRLTDWPIATRPAVEHGNGQKHFFHLLDMAILNSYILLLSCSEKKISQKGFRLALVSPDGLAINPDHPCL